MSLMSRLAGIPLLAAATAFAAPPPAPPKAAAPAPAPVLEGTVVGPDGKPVAQAFVSAWVATAVRAFPSPMSAPLLTRTDTAGRFRLPLRERGAHGVRVEVDGFAPSVLDRVTPSSGPLRIALAKGLAIEGVVKDGPTGIAVAGATVEARDERWRDFSLLWEKGPAVPRAVTDGQGRFRIQGLAAGPHTVVARARGFGQAARRSISAGGRAELILYPTGAVTGIVRGPDGRPVADAKIAVEPVMRFSPGSRVETTDLQGRFEFMGVDPGSYRVVARHPDFAAGWTNVTVERQADTDTAISLDPPLAVVGRLVDGTERPVRGRMVVSEAAGGALPPSLASSYAVEVAADGRFRIAGLPGGAAVLSATAPGFGAKRVEVELSPARAETDLGAVAMETGLTISGRVRDKAGQGIPDARVSGQPSRRMMMGAFTQPETTTEVDGRFVLGGLEPGHYDLNVQAPGFGFGRKDADAGAEGVDIVAEPAGALTGTVVDENKQPVTSFRVNIRPVERFQLGRMVVAQGTFRMQTFESPDGRFLMDDLAPAEVSVQVFATDREPASVPSVAVPAGGTADVGQLRLGPGGVIRGAVVDAAGGAVGGATVRSQGPGRDFFMGTFPETATDASGAFELRGLPPGSVNVIATHPAYAAAHTTVDVEQGKPAEARLVLTQGGRIEGRARKRDGTPVVGMINVFSRSSAMAVAGNLSTPVGPDGTFAMEHVPVGRLNLSLMLGSGPRFEGSQNQEVDVREGETTNVEFLLRDILVSGRVTRGGTPAPNMRVTVRGQSMMFMSIAGPSAAAPAGGPQRLRAVTREDGSYELLVDQPGKVSFMVEAADGSLTLPQRSVEIPDAERHVVDLDYAGLATVSGIVLDEDGETPVARANVYAMPKEPRPGMSRLAAETGTDGRFQLEMDPGEYQIGARLQGYGNVPEVVNVGASGLTDLRLTVSRGGVVKGRVVDASGRPRAGVFVQGFQVTAQGASPSSGGVAMTLPDGTFEMSGLGESEHTLLVRGETGDFGFTSGVRPGREGVTITMRRGGRIQVHILGPDGAPVSGAFAMVTKVGEAPLLGFGGAPSDSAGMTEVTTPAGAIQIRANKDNLEGTASTVVTTDGVASLEVRLAPKAASRSGN